MPVFISKNDNLTYIPDREGFANFPPELQEAITTWQAQCEAQHAALLAFLATLPLPEPVSLPEVLAIPLRVPPLLLEARGRVALFDTKDVVYRYKRPLGHVRAAIIHRHTSLGMTDFHSARYELGATAVFGWENVLDDTGAQIPFDTAIIPYLPGAHMISIGILTDSGAPTDFLSTWLGSLNGSSSSPETTAGAAEHAS